MMRVPMPMPFSRLLLPLVLLAAPASAQDSVDLGLQTYQSCILCHGPDGKGMKAGDLVMGPSLPESGFIQAGNAEMLAAIIFKGIAKEDNRYFQMMVGLEPAFTDEQIASVIGYVIAEFGKKQVSVRTKDVAKWRVAYAAQKAPWKRSDLESMLREIREPKLLSDLTYELFEGKWSKLPSFADLTPVRTGGIDKGLVTLGPAKDIKVPFGLTFKGTLTIPESEEFEFALTSDDGAVLAIDGEAVINNDGIHPASTKKAKEKLEAGVHSLKVLYFDGGGERSLSLSIQGKKLGLRWLSEERRQAGGGAQSYDPILLAARNPGEAVVHRAFLPDANPRAIAVGYPGRVNLVWDADTLNVAYLYRGDFINAASHWNARGSGSTPIGVDRVKPAVGFPFQVLESLDDPWTTESKATIRYERDSADPQKEIRFHVKHPDYQFLGYRLDERRFPEFRYRFRTVEVTDRARPEVVEGSEALVREVTVKGAAGANTWFRAAATGPLTRNDAGWYDLGGGMELRLEGAEPVVRENSGRKELLAAIPGETALAVTYRWSAPLPPPAPKAESQ